ncbi:MULTISPECIES: Xaa-Pro aminopeptidase [unclassified Methylocaldum]|jgi:Xaa-Pro aminopeptidase|uniref:Xaa-Pro aminopeptidase n=1 Tax=unclassified Methylocaldum TaxID=2622260 RepID=UPI00098B8F30|nr:MULTISPECIES: Xaa-Pro aminopeptidase [unclassified Methylocaldum]MBP1149473.1 Xaa-Pro aminopeptidase [Methylocaldum sp. RMAD-M]MVF23483.1 Xaa-Pro aminopeptidase [Methylocaldum sp. BRCS4]
MLQPSEFKQRRKQLARRIKKKSVALIASASASVRNRDVEYPYRQDSDFHYLTGFDEPEAVAVFAPGRKQGEYILFCREFDREKAIWTGRHAGLEGARNAFGADEAFPIDELDKVLPGLLENRERVYFPIGHDPKIDRQVFSAVNNVRARVRTGVRAPFEFVSLEHLLHEQRLIKTSHEIQLMQKAAEVSVRAHKRAMSVCKPGKYEYEIEAELLYEFTRHGMRAPAYPCIVAGGHNACVLHYTENKDVLKDGDLLLIDAGAEYENYAADITRTFPINGRFSESQRLLYDLVLEAQLDAIEQVRAGNRWNAPHDAAVHTLTKGLVKLGLLEGRVSKLIKDEAYKKFYMHRTGHWLGMDVHDVGEYRSDGEWRSLEPGMVLTVEPGLYVAPDCHDVDPKWRGIGIRIEDDVLVTKDGCEILTAGLPKTAAEIEAFMANPE